jgi:exodeoxyribonuclease VII small subunit
LSGDGVSARAGGALSLEGRLRRLEEIVGRLESEELNLDEALALFEEGIGHVREAESSLAAAELRVEELLGEGESLTTRPLDEEEA